MTDAAFDLIRQAASHEGRIFVNDDNETGPALANDLLARGLLVQIVGDMTGPDKGQWYEMTAAAWDMYWHKQRSQPHGGVARQDQSFSLN